MRIERVIGRIIKTGIKVGVAGSLAACSTAPLTPQSSDSQTLNAHVVACFDGGLNNKPDGKCQTEGDIPLAIKITAQDIFGNPLVETQTDAEKGEADMVITIPKGNSVYLRHEKVLLTKNNGKSVFVCAKEKIDPLDKDKVNVTLPFNPKNCFEEAPKGPIA